MDLEISFLQVGTEEHKDVRKRGRKIGGKKKVCGSTEGENVFEIPQGLLITHVFPIDSNFCFLRIQKKEKMGSSSVLFW